MRLLREFRLQLLFADVPPVGPRALKGCYEHRIELRQAKLPVLASTLAQTVITGEIVDAATGLHVVVITGSRTAVPVLSGIKGRYCRVPALRVRH